MAKQKKSTAPAAEPQTEKAETPEWVYSTPEENDYRLVMFVTGGDSAEEFTVSRDEYIAAKHCIARMRGYDLRVPESVRTSQIHTLELTPAPEAEENSLTEAESPRAELRAMVTQETLATLFYLNRAVDELSMSLKHRIMNGEEIEPGIYTASILEEEDPDIEYLGYNNCGLDLDRQSEQEV